MLGVFKHALTYLLLKQLYAINCDSMRTFIVQSFLTHFKVYPSSDDSRLSINMVQNKESL